MNVCSMFLPTSPLQSSLLLSYHPAFCCCPFCCCQASYDPSCSLLSSHRNFKLFILPPPTFLISVKLLLCRNSSYYVSSQVTFYKAFHRAFRRAFHKDYIEALYLYSTINNHLNEYHCTSTSQREGAWYPVLE